MNGHSSHGVRHARRTSKSSTSPSRPRSIAALADLDNLSRLGKRSAHRLLDKHRRTLRQMVEQISVCLGYDGDVEHDAGHCSDFIERAADVRNAVLIGKRPGFRVIAIVDRDDLE